MYRQLGLEQVLDHAKRQLLFGLAGVAEPLFSLDLAEGFRLDVVDLIPKALVMGGGRRLAGVQPGELAEFVLGGSLDSNSGGGLLRALLIRPFRQRDRDLPIGFELVERGVDQFERGDNAGHCR